MSIRAREAAKKICELGNWNVSNLRLQKILYFAHMACLVKHKEPLIDEQFHAWLYGPVVPKLYHDFKKYGSGPIKAGLQNVESINPSSNEAAIIEEAWDCFSEDSPSRLIEYTHRKGGAWDRNYTLGLRSAFRTENPIPDEHIKEEYMELLRN